MALEIVKPKITENERKILNKVVKPSIETSSELTEHFFSSTDDLFYELSERASTNNEENLYFEAMRAIRLAKNDIDADFLAELREQFQNIQHQAPVDAEKDTAELAVVGREDLEIELAQKNMADRTRDIYKRELYELEARLDALFSQFAITAKNNPFDPLNFSRCFVKASMAHLKIEVKTRLIFFKLFEKHVLKQLGHLYAHANAALAEEGIEPKNQKKTNSDDGPASAIEQQEQEQVQPEAFDSFENDQESYKPFQLQTSTLSALMSSVRNARKSSSKQLSGFSNYQNYSTNPGVVMPVLELANLLTQTQTSIDKNIGHDSPKNVVPEIVTDILSKRDPEQPQALEQLDEDVINLVALFFDKVLEDDNLPIAIQSLICRLQIPILKIALRDKTFLTNEEHPARLLINTITRAGLSFDSSKPVEKDPMFKVINEGVQKVNAQFDTDSEVFDEVRLEISEAARTEAKRSETVEARTKQTETGKAKLKAARSFVQNTIYERIKDVKLPYEIANFLTDAWLQVLVITHIRSGNDSADWIRFEQCISDLVWITQRHSDEKSIARRDRLEKDVLVCIEEGLLHTVDDVNSRKNQITLVSDTLKKIRSEIPDEDIYQNVNEEQLEKLDKKDPENKNWDEMTALERQKASYEELSSQNYLYAKNMPLNTWLEYSDAEKGKNIRCKLSAKIDADNYIFVNRFGFKTLTKSRRQFAYDIQFKKAKILETGPVFERLMEKVIAQIKSVSKEL